MVLGAIVGIIAIVGTLALVFSFKDDIKNRINPPSPEELQVEKEKRERGFVKNVQAFTFGEESLEPSNAPPNLASLQKDTKVIQRNLGIPNNANFTVTNKGVIISDKPPRFALSTKERLSAVEALRRNRRKTQKQNEAFDIQTQSFQTGVNTNNRIGKQERVSKGQKQPIRKRQFRVRSRGLIPTQTNTNARNVVPIRQRRTSNLRKSQGITETNIEIKEVNQQIG